MRNVWILSLIAWAFLALPNQANAKSFTVRYGQYKGLTTLDAGTVSADATRMLKNGTDKPQDVKCNVTFSSPKTKIFESPFPYSVNNQQNLSKLKQLKADFVLVYKITFCGGKKPYKGTSSFSGCSTTPVLIADSRIKSQKSKTFGIVVAHEYGHKRGLHHHKSSNNLMYWDARKGDEKLDANQCSKYSGEKPFVARVAEADEDDKAADETSDTFVCPDKFRALVESYKNYIGEGGPPQKYYDCARKFAGDPDAMSDAAEILRDKSAQDIWVETGDALKIVATPEAGKVATDFMLEDIDTELVGKAWDAKSDVPVILSIIANPKLGSGDPAALDTLLQCSDADWWKSKNVTRKVRPIEEIEELTIEGDAVIQELVAQCVWGLAMSTTLEGKCRIKKLQDMHLRANKERLLEESKLTSDKINGLLKPDPDCEELIERQARSVDGDARVYNAYSDNTARALDPLVYEEVPDGSRTIDGGEPRTTQQWVGLKQFNDVSDVVRDAKSIEDYDRAAE